MYDSCLNPFLWSAYWYYIIIIFNSIYSSWFLIITDVIKFKACGRQLKVPESGSDVIDCRAEFFSDYDEFDGGRDNICSYTLEAENPSKY